MQNINDEDFIVEIKFDSDINERYQSQGIIVEESSNNWIRFDFFSDGSNQRIFAATFVDSVPSVRLNKTININTPMWMRVERERTGDTWTLSSSIDGTNWISEVTFSHTMVVNAIGPFGGNFSASGDAPAGPRPRPHRGSARC